MKFRTSLWLFLAIGINASSALVVAGNVLFQRIQSDGAIAHRAKGLEVISQHVLSKTCWNADTKHPYKLGDVVPVAGSIEGRIPTGCLFNAKHNQFLQVAYSDGILKVNQVYSRQEVRNKISQLKQP